MKRELPDSRDKTIRKEGLFATMNATAEASTPSEEDGVARASGGMVVVTSKT